MKTTMKFMMVCCLVAFSAMSYGQQRKTQLKNRTVSGYVLDSCQRLPVEYAAIQTFEVDNEKRPLVSTISDSTGYFMLSGSLPDQVTLTISCIGYARKSVQINLNKNKTRIEQPILLQPSSFTLNEVSVTTSPYIMNSDRSVFVPDSIAIANSVTSIDLLGHVPELQVNKINNSVSIIGKSTLVLVNGMMREGFDISTISMDDIAKIEVVQNPSSRYETDIEGIVNIVLKSEVDKGVFGYASASNLFPAKRTEGSLVLQYSFSKMRLYGNYYYGRWATKNETETFRTPLDGTMDNSYISQSVDLPKENYHSFRLGFDYIPNDKTLFNAFAEIKTYDKRFTDTTMIQYMNGLETVNHSLKNDTTKGLYQNYSLYFKRSFDGALRQISSDANLYFMKSSDVAHYNEDYQIGNTSSAVDRLQYDDGYKASVNYHLDGIVALAEAHRIEFGGQYYYQHFKDVFTEVQDDFTFDFKESQVSLYSDYYATINKWSLKAGARYTYDDRNSNDSLSHYHYLLPSVSVAYRMDDDIVSLRYNRRLYTPAIWSLCPQVVMLDSVTFSTGNPYLRPQINDVAELNLRLNRNKNVFSTSLYYTHSGSVIRTIYYLDNGKLYTAPFNISTLNKLGAKASASFNLFDESLEIESFIDFHHDTYSYNQEQKSAFIISTSLSIDYTFPWGMSTGVSFDYTNKQLLPQGFAKGTPQISTIYLRQSFLGNRGAIMLAYQDLFKNIYERTVEYDTYTQLTKSLSYTSGIFLKIDYWFSKGKQNRNVSRREYTEEDIK